MSYQEDLILASHIREQNQRIQELEAENEFLKQMRASHESMIKCLRLDWYRERSRRRWLAQKAWKAIHGWRRYMDCHDTSGEDEVLKALAAYRRKAYREMGE